jgi:hypothetical protein
MNKPRCTNNDDTYCWIDNRKVMGITYKDTWGPFKEINTNIKIM